MLRPSSETSFYGEPYLLNGWWIDSQEGWFFKREYDEQLIDYGAVYAKVKTKSSKSSSCKSKKSNSISSSEDVHSESPFTKPTNLSVFAVTEYGKGLMVTCSNSHPFMKNKKPYLLGNNGFWNASSKGWFFKMKYLSDLEELGAKYIKTESTSEEEDYIYTDSQLSYKSVFEKYGRGYIIYADAKYTYSKLGKYFKGGFWMPQQEGWFFKKEAMKAFIENNK